MYFIPISRVKQSQLPIYKAIYRVYFTPSITFVLKAHPDSLDSSGSHRGAVQTRWKFHWHQALIEILAKAKALPQKKIKIWQINRSDVKVICFCSCSLFKPSIFLQYIQGFETKTTSEWIISCFINSCLGWQRSEDWFMKCQPLAGPQKGMGEVSSPSSSAYNLIPSFPTNGSANYFNFVELFSCPHFAQKDYQFRESRDISMIWYR